MRRANTSACNCSLSDRSCSTASLCLLSRTGAHTGLTSHRASSCSLTEPCSSRSNAQQQQDRGAAATWSVPHWPATCDYADNCQSGEAPAFNIHRNSIDIVQGRASHMLCCNVCCLTSNGDIPPCSLSGTQVMCCCRTAPLHIRVRQHQTAWPCELIRDLTFSESLVRSIFPQQAGHIASERLATWIHKRARSRPVSCSSPASVNLGA